MKNRMGVFVLYLIMLIVGLGALAVGLILGTDPEMYLVKAFCVPSGLVLMLVALYNIIAQLTMNEKQRKKNLIEQKDERNTLIRGLAASFCQKLVVLMLGVGCFCCSLCNQIVGAFILAGILIIDAAAILISTWYFSRKY